MNRIEGWRYFLESCEPPVAATETIRGLMGNKYIANAGIQYYKQAASKKDAKPSIPSKEHPRSPNFENAFAMHWKMVK